MIDKNKIKSAAQGYCDATYGTLNTDPFIAEAFRKGANWAINQYLEDLLHPVSEIPHSKDGYCCVYIFRKNKDISNVLYIEKENIWDELVNGYQGIAWCYINELFPKKKSFDLIKKRGKQ